MKILEEFGVAVKKNGRYSVTMCEDYFIYEEFSEGLEYSITILIILFNFILKKMISYLVDLYRLPTYSETNRVKLIWTFVALYFNTGILI